MKKIGDRVYYFGLADKDRKIFDQLVPLLQGTTYNSYAIRGDNKCALVDTMYSKFEGRYIDMLAASGLKFDYIISNHAEPDHSGAMNSVLKMFPEAVVLCSQKCSQNLQNMVGVDAGRIRVVGDGEELDLGGVTLKFLMTPWVHWPDTMFTYYVEEKMLFSCDFFGAHFTNFELFADDSPELADSAKRYYSEIMMPFANFCRKYLKLAEELAPSMILPSHGAVYANPEFILNLYREWTSPDPTQKVLIGYISMYENTKLMSEYLGSAMRALGLEAKLVDLMETDEGELAMDLIDASALVIGVSMVLAGPHPRAVYAAYLASLLRPKLKFYSVIGSFGWGGNLTGAIESNLKIPGLEKIEPVIAKGRPLPADFAALDALAQTFKQKLSDLNK